MLQSSSILPLCFIIVNTSSLSKSPPTKSGQSQYSFSAVCLLATSQSVHESHSSAPHRPCSDPIAALWVKGYCWSRRAGRGRVGRKGEQDPKESKKRGRNEVNLLKIAGMSLATRPTNTTALTLVSWKRKSNKTLMIWAFSEQMHIMHQTYWKTKHIWICICYELIPVKSPLLFAPHACESLEAGRLQQLWPCRESHLTGYKTHRIIWITALKLVCFSG